MTKQIVIKLNEKKFRPLLDALGDMGSSTSGSYSEEVGKIIFATFLHFTEKDPKLGGKTQREFFMDMLEKAGESKEEYYIKFLQRYKEFQKNGNNH